MAIVLQRSVDYSQDINAIRKADFMHEMAVVSDIVEVICERAEELDARQIVTLELHIGAMRDIHEPLLQRYFDFFSRGTIAEGVQVRVETIPLRYRCDVCGCEYEYDLKNGKVVSYNAGSQSDIQTKNLARYLEEAAAPCCALHPDGGVSLISGTELSIEKIGVI